MQEKFELSRTHPPSRHKHHRKLEEKKVLLIYQNWKKVKENRRGNPIEIASWANLLLELPIGAIHIKSCIQQEEVEPARCSIRGTGTCEMNERMVQSSAPVFNAM